MKLKKKVVVITGGTKGLGKALAYSFLREGANVIICARSIKEFKDLSKEGIVCRKADVTKENDMDDLLKFTLKKFSQIDIWINNAGLWLKHLPTEDFDMDKAKKMFDVNVYGTINGSRTALRYMKKKGKGTIVNIISDSALVGRACSSMYSSSKWAVNGFTKSIREENKKLSIISVYPGAFKSEIFGKIKPDNYDNFMEVSFVAEKIINNLKKDKIKEEIIIKKR